MQNNHDNKKAADNNPSPSKKENSEMQDAMLNESEHKEAYQNPEQSEDDGRSPEDLDTMSDAESTEDDQTSNKDSAGQNPDRQKEEKNTKSEKVNSDKPEKQQSEGIEEAFREESEGKKAYNNPNSKDDGRSEEDLDHMSEAESSDDSPSSSQENKASAEDKTSESVTKSEGDLDREDQEKMDDNIAEDSEDHTSSERYDIEIKDYHAMNLQALTEEFQRLLKNHKVQHIREHVRELKIEFDAKFEEEYEQKKEEFLEDGGNIIDFHYRTPVKKDFDKTYFEYREKRDNYYKKLKKDLNENLEERLAIIEDLKNMVGRTGSMHSNFEEFKKLQERWKKAGPVPRDQYKKTWNTYHHHVENFYDFLHLDREFRDMDFKHNLEQKLKMIARAEELAQESNINRAFRELQMLHKMWKEDVGPVAKEYREPIWEKFSAATKQVHKNRREHYAELDEKRRENLTIKQQLIDDIWEIESKEITSHNQAQQLIKAVNKLRDKFFNAGRVPKKDNQEVWNNFKEATRKFNRKKNAFYKDWKKEQKDNLAKKKELVEIAERNKDSDDFDSVTPLMKKIQAEWKTVGRVPRKQSDKVWKAFKKACNHYFDRLHAQKNQEKEVELKAYKEKEELLKATKSMELEGDHEKDLAAIKEKISAWKELGAVPRDKKFIEGKFNKALDQLFQQLDIDKKQAEMLKYEKKVNALSGEDKSDQIEKEERFLRKRITEKKNEIRQLETNLEMFNNADKNNPLMKEAYKNIERHKEQLETWKAKLKKIKSL